MFTHPTMLSQLAQDRSETLQAEARQRHLLRAARPGAGHEGNRANWLDALRLHLFGPLLAR